MSRSLAYSVVAGLLSVVAFADVSEETKQSGTHPRVLPQTIVATQIAHAAPWREPCRGWLGRYPNQPLLVDPDLPDDPDRTDIPEYPNWGNFTSQADYDITLREVKLMGIDGIAKMIFGFTPKRFFSAVETSSVKDVFVLPILFPRGEVGKIVDGMAKFVGNKRLYRHDGKILLPS